MNKNETIKSVINKLLEHRNKQIIIFEAECINGNMTDFITGEKLTPEETEQVIRNNRQKITEDWEVPLAQLNSLLSMKEKNNEVIDIEFEMKKMQSKKIISGKELAEIYGISITQQKRLRGRLNDPIPFSQLKKGGKVMYEVEKVNQWKQNQYK
jgi:hypothetical protein